MSDPVRDSLVDSAYLPPPASGPFPERSLSSIPADTSPFLPPGAKEPYLAANDSDASFAPLAPARRPLYRRPWVWLVAAAGLVAVAAEHERAQRGAAQRRALRRALERERERGGAAVRWGHVWDDGEERGEEAVVEPGVCDVQVVQGGEAREGFEDRAEVRKDGLFGERMPGG